ncbi:MAG: type II toxin-antitoxin system PemK/MazF family toxin [archaeon]
MVEIKRGDIVLVNLEPVKGSEQGGVRPCLIIQNDKGNKYSPLAIIAPLTSKEFTKEFATNVFVSKEDSKLDKDSTILLNQIKTIDKRRIVKKISFLDSEIMKKIDMAIKISLGLV